MTERPQGTFEMIYPVKGTETKLRCQCEGEYIYKDYVDDKFRHVCNGCNKEVLIKEYSYPRIKLWGN